MLVDVRRWKLVGKCAVTRAIDKMARITGSAGQNTDTSGVIRPASLLSVDSLSEMIGRVRPEAVVLNIASLHPGASKSQGFFKKF